MATTVDFLRRVKSSTLLPTHQQTFQDDDILDFANEEMDSLVVPEIMTLRQEYFVTKTVVGLSAGVSEVAIPERAVGRTIRDLKFLPTNNNLPVTLPLLPISDNASMNQTVGVPRYHYFQGDKIIINPTPDQDYGDLWLFWEIRPSRLVVQSEVGIISNVGTHTVTVQRTLNSDITTGAVVDIIGAKAGYAPIYLDQIISSITTGLGPKVITLSGFSPSNPITGVSVGDHLSLAFTSDIIGLPEEAVAVLVQATSIRLLQGMDLPSQLAQAEKRLEVCLKSMRKALSPRNEASSYKIRPQSPMFGPGRRNSIISTSGN
jgi:hypothetical protein